MSHIYTVFGKRTPTHVSFYTFTENAQISTKFSGNVQQKTSIPTMEKLGILCYW